MNYSKVSTILFSLIFTTIISCGPSIRTAKKTNKNLKQFDSFAWLPSQEEIKNPDYNNDVVYSSIVSEVNTTLKDKGYSVDRDNPDILIMARTMFNKKSETVKEPIYGTSYTYSYPYNSINNYYQPYYYNRYQTVTNVVGYDVEQVTYTEGTFMIDVIDAKTNNLLWRGWSKEVIQPENLKYEIANYVDEIFEEYPNS